jgi:hypothetical protein
MGVEGFTSLQQRTPQAPSIHPLTKLLETPNKATVRLYAVSGSRVCPTPSKFFCLKPVGGSMKRIIIALALLLIALSAAHVTPALRQEQAKA